MELDLISSEFYAESFSFCVQFYIYIFVPHGYKNNIVLLQIAVLTINTINFESFEIDFMTP